MSTLCSPVRTVSPPVSLFTSDLALPAADAQQDHREDPIDDPGEELVEGRAPRQQGSPGDPSTAEVEEHRLMGHAVYRSWCPSCVRGRGRDDRHGATRRDDSEVPIISFDYCFLSSRACARDHPEGDATDESHQSPVLVMWDSRSKGLFAHMVAAEGVDNSLVDRAVAVVCDDLSSLGYKRVVFRSDNEPAILAFLRLVARTWDGEVIPDSSAEGDPHSNDAAENAYASSKASSVP